MEKEQREGGELEGRERWGGGEGTMGKRRKEEEEGLEGRERWVRKGVVGGRESVGGGGEGGERGSGVGNERGRVKVGNLLHLKEKKNGRLVEMK